jgi:predicted esterase
VTAAERAAGVRYAAVSDAVFELYAEARFEEALAVLDDAGPELGPWQAELAHLRACLLGRLGEPARALRVLQHAQSAGAWWAPDILSGDDDLAALEQLPDFPALVAASHAAWTAANARLERSGDRLVLPAKKACGLVVALHGAEQDADDAVDDWGGVVAKGWSLLAVRSSQRTSPRYRSWPDEGIAHREIAAAIAEAPAGLAGGPLVAAGFSAGGRVALRWALTARPVPVSGVVAVAPAMQDQQPPQPAAPLSPATLVVGADDDLAEQVRLLAAQLPDFQLNVRLGHGHRVPADVAALVTHCAGNPVAPTAS